MLPSDDTFPQFTTVVWNSCRRRSSKVWWETNRNAADSSVVGRRPRTPAEATVSRLTSAVLGTPARDPAGQAFGEGLSAVQTNGLDVVAQGGPGFQMKHGYVRPSDVAESDVCHICCGLKGVGSILIQTAQNDGPLGRYRRAVVQSSGLGQVLPAQTPKVFSESHDQRLGWIRLSSRLN